MNGGIVMPLMARLAFAIDVKRSIFRAKRMFFTVLKYDFVDLFRFYFNNGATFVTY